MSIYVFYWSFALYWATIFGTEDVDSGNGGVRCRDSQTNTSLREIKIPWWTYDSGAGKQSSFFQEQHNATWTVLPATC